MRAARTRKKFKLYVFKPKKQRQGVFDHPYRHCFGHVVDKQLGSGWYGALRKEHQPCRTLPLLDLQCVHICGAAVVHQPAQPAQLLLRWWWRPLMYRRVGWKRACKVTVVFKWRTLLRLCDRAHSASACFGTPARAPKPSTRSPQCGVRSITHRIALPTRAASMDIGLSGAAAASSALPCFTDGTTRYFVQILVLSDEASKVTHSRALNCTAAGPLAAGVAPTSSRAG